MQLEAADIGVKSIRPMDVDFNLGKKLFYAKVVARYSFKNKDTCARKVCFMLYGVFVGATKGSSVVSSLHDPYKEKYILGY